MFSRSVIDNYRSIFDDCRNVIDNSIATLQLVASFTIVIYNFHNFIVPATVINIIKLLTVVLVYYKNL
jgi:hypothetical protein